MLNAVGAAFANTLRFFTTRTKELSIYTVTVAVAVRLRHIRGSSTQYLLLVKRQVSGLPCVLHAAEKDTEVAGVPRGMTDDELIAFFRRHAATKAKLSRLDADRELPGPAAH